MMIHEITEKVGKYPARKRVGRGNASGLGGTSGRGHKGAKSRSGWKRKVSYEGGRMRYFRRMPKRGFNNVNFATAYSVVNIKALDKHCADGASVDAASLKAIGLVDDAARPLKVLGEGETRKKLHVTAARLSKSAKAKIEKAGGKFVETNPAPVVEPKPDPAAKAAEEPAKPEGKGAKGKSKSEKPAGKAPKGEGNPAAE
jgi:large subunit ribosomal protein L15